MQFSSSPLIFQLLHKLLLACLSLPKPPPVLKHPGSYHQQRTGMETLPDLNYSIKRKVLQGHQPWKLSTVDQL